MIVARIATCRRRHSTGILGVAAASSSSTTGNWILQLGCRRRIRPTCVGTVGIVFILRQLAGVAAVAGAVPGDLLFDLIHGDW